MDFDRYDAGAATVAEDLVNSLGSITGTEYLPDPEALREFLEDHGIGVPERVTDDDVASVHRLRARLRETFEAPTEAGTVAVLNRLLADVGALPQVTDHEGHPWHLHYVAPDAPVADHLAAISAMGLAGVIVTYGRDRLGICAADNCRDVFVDTSRNMSRRYCNETCSSRVNVARYRARHKESS